MRLCTISIVEPETFLPEVWRPYHSTTRHTSFTQTRQHQELETAAAAACMYDSQQLAVSATDNDTHHTQHPTTYQSLDQSRDDCMSWRLRSIAIKQHLSVSMQVGSLVTV